MFERLDCLGTPVSGAKTTLIKSVRVYVHRGAKTTQKKSVKVYKR
jgi:hypothetical protein